MCAFTLHSYIQRERERDWTQALNTVTSECWQTIDYYYSTYTYMLSFLLATSFRVLLLNCDFTSLVCAFVGRLICRSIAILHFCSLTIYPIEEHISICFCLCVIFSSCPVFLSRVYYIYGLFIWYKCTRALDHMYFSVCECVWLDFNCSHSKCECSCGTFLGLSICICHSHWHPRMGERVVRRRVNACYMQYICSIIHHI